MEIHIYREGDAVRVEGKGSVEEARKDALSFVEDIDNKVVSPRLKQLAQDVKAAVSGTSNVIR